MNIPGMMPSIPCYVPPSVELLGPPFSHWIDASGRWYYKSCWL